MGNRVSLLLMPDIRIRSMGKLPTVRMEVAEGGR